MSGREEREGGGEVGRLDLSSQVYDTTSIRESKDESPQKARFVCKQPIAEGKEDA